MSTNSKPPSHWVIRDVIPGDVSIGDSEPRDGFQFRATARVTATVVNGCGGRSEIKFDVRSGIENPEDVGMVVDWVVKIGIEGARNAARAFCDAANAAAEAA